MAVFGSIPIGTLNAQLKTNDRSFNKAVREAIVAKYRNMFKNAEAPIKNRITPIFAKAITNTNIVQELLSGGPLMGHLGLEDAGDLVDIVLQWTLNEIIVKSTLVRSVGDKIQGHIYVGMIYADYQDVFKNPSASFESEQGFKIPWLPWLIDSAGQDAFAIEYGIKFGEGLGRTGQAIMVKNARQPWTLPVQYLGSPEDNFVTQALDSIEDQVLEIMIQEIEKQI